MQSLRWEEAPGQWRFVTRYLNSYTVGGHRYIVAFGRVHGAAAPHLPAPGQRVELRIGPTGDPIGGRAVECTPVARMPYAVWMAGYDPDPAWDGRCHPDRIRSGPGYTCYELTFTTD